MTAIVGLKHQGRVWIGGDSAGVAGWSLTSRADEKVFRNGPFVFGFTTSFRMGQLLRHAFTPPTRDDRMPVDKFMSTTFVDAVRACLKSGGYATTKEGAEVGGAFLVGYGEHLFGIESDYQVGQPMGDSLACGCGHEIALGALFGAPKSMRPEARVRKALEAAATYSAGVRGPFTILSTEKTKRKASA